MKKRDGHFLSVIFTTVVLLLGICSNVQAKESVLYGGGPLYNNAATHRDMIRASGFTTIILWTIHVYADGDLVLNDKKIVDNGVYVGRAEWPDEVAAFKTGSTSVRRIEIAIGSWGVADFENIESLIDAQGTGPDSILYKNFKVIRDVIPAIDAVSYDDESNYDVDSSVALALMLNDMGFKVTLCPYTYSGYWSSVYSNVQSQRPGAIDRIDLQCYAGGGGNNPGTWNTYFGGLRVTPGLWCYPNSPNGKTPAQVESQMASWNTSYNIAGGFMWLLDDMLNYQGTYPVADYANAINNALAIDPSIRSVATLYQHCPYGGWSADLGIGAYTASDIVLAGGVDNDASSVKINSGYKVTFYNGDNFTGPALVKTADDTCLVDDGWNDLTSSLVVDVDPILMGHWQFNDNSGFIAGDNTGNGFHGTLVNMDAGSWTVGKQCGGLDFDGVDDSIEISDGSVLNPNSNSWSVAFWLRSQTSSQGAMIISKRANVAPYTQYSVGLSAGNSYSWLPGRKLTFLFREAAGFEKGGYTLSDTDISDWTHVAVILDKAAGTVHVYINGISVPVVLDHDEQLPVIYNSSPLYIGGNPNVPNFYQGLIDDVRIYNYSLSETEIQQIYQQDALMADTEPDGDVDLNDFAALANSWNVPDSCDADLTCDCVVDMDDLMILVSEWLGVI